MELRITGNFILLSLHREAIVSAKIKLESISDSYATVWRELKASCQKHICMCSFMRV